MSEPALLGPDELLPERSFTDPAWSERDRGVMEELLARERALARSALSVEGIEGQQVLRGRDENDHAYLLVVPDVQALLEAENPTAVGFFGRAREGVDHSILFHLEDELIGRMPEHGRAGLLSYFDVELVKGSYGNLILFSTPDVPAAWHGDEIHRRAVEISPGHYENIRLHKGVLRGRLLDGGGITLERTRYFDFTGPEVWQATRTLTAA